MSGRALEQRIDAAQAALDEDALVRLALELTAVASPTGEEAEVAEVLHDRMRERGLTARVDPIAEQRANVLGVRSGSGGGRTLMFNAHLDTLRGPEHDADAPVPAPEARLVDGEWIGGPGVSNMKGVLAAYVEAVSAVRRAGIELAGDVLVAGVAGGFQSSPVDSFQGGRYRGFGVGTQHLLTQGGVADMCVLGDTTAFELVRGFFGIVHARIDIRGTISAGFRSDAIDHAAEVVRALNAWTPGYRQRTTVEGVPPNVDILAIEGGWPWTTDRRPATCSVFVGIGTPPEGLPLAVKHELQQVLTDLRAIHPSLNASVELYATNAGTIVPEDSPVVAAVRAAHANVFSAVPVPRGAADPYLDLAHLAAGVIPYFCDAAHLNRYGIPTVNYGPGHEYSPAGEDLLRISDLVLCTRVYTDLIVRVCSSP